MSILSQKKLLNLLMYMQILSSYVKMLNQSLEIMLKKAYVTENNFVFELKSLGSLHIYNI